MNFKKLKHRTLSLFLACMLMLTALLPMSVSAASSHEDFLRVFHLDVGRKYFTVAQVTELIDALSASGYTHMELAIGNGGLRMLLDDMSVTVGSTTYTSEKVSAGIKAGNVSFAHAGEWSQSEMDSIIRYAASKNIGIIPLVNSPGHMSAILDAAEYVGISSPAYSAKVSSGWWGSTSTKTSSTTVSLSNASAVAFTQALIRKYVEYFAANGCEYFNIGADEYAADVHSSGSMGFGYMQSNGWYDDYVNYINDVAAIIKNAGMKPIAFNDGIYFNENDDTAFDRDIIIAYWIPAWGTYYVASPAYLVSKGHKILNTNDDWYYVIGRTSEGYGYDNAYNGVNNTPVTKVADGTTMALTNLAGSMNCVWCDEPNASYDANKSNVMYFIETLAQKNPDYFVVNTHAHTYETVTVDPTCTDDGSVTTVCTGCGEKTVETLAAYGHSYTRTETDASCITDGVITYTCSACADTYTETVPAKGHQYTGVVTEATCTERGFTTYTCSSCGDSYTSDYTDSKGHSYTTTVINASCTEDGSVTYLCDCGDRYTEVIAAYGHSYRPEVSAPTCSEDGYTTHTCTACGDSYITDIEAAKGHSIETTVKAPTCTEDGYTLSVCTVCGYSTVSDEMAALGHEYVSETVSPTETEDGYTLHTCRSCGHSYTDSYVDALGHSLVSVVTAPTCTEDGYTTHTCTTCGEVTVDSYVPAPGHSYETTVTDASCTSDGSVSGICHACGDTCHEVIPSYGHDYTAAVTAPTCTDSGHTDYTCTRCGDSYTDDYTDAPGHAYTSVVTDATCTEDGYVTYLCTACGDSYIGETIASVGHAYLTVTVDAACTENGSVTKTCEYCGDSSTEIIPAVGHKYETVVTEPTCTGDGCTTHTCTACGDRYTDTPTQALGHSYSTEEVNGNLVHTCDRCGDTYTESTGWVNLTGKYVLDTDGIDIGSEHKYIVVASDRDYALTVSGTSVSAAAVTVSGNTLTQDNADKYEFFFADNSAKESGSYLLTQNGTGGIYHMGGNLYYGTDNKGYWHIGSGSMGSYQLYDYDNQTWYLNYGYVWANESVSRFAVSSNARTVRLFKATDSYVRLSGNLTQTWSHGADVTEAAVLEQLRLQTSADGITVQTSVPLTQDMLTIRWIQRPYSCGRGQRSCCLYSCSRNPCMCGPRIPVRCRWVRWFLFYMHAHL